MSDDANIETVAAVAVEPSSGLQRISLQELKDKPSSDLVAFAESLEIENASSMRKQDMLFIILKALAEDGVEIFRLRHVGGDAGRLRLPALARGQLPARTRRHLRFALPDPQVRASHRRHGGRPDPRAARGRALLRHPEGRHDQFRGPRGDQAQGPLRQPDPALPRAAADHGDGRPDAEGTAPAGSSTSSRRSARASAASSSPRRGSARP